MVEKSITARNKKLNLKPVQDVVVVKYKKSMDSNRALDIISSKEGFNIEGTNINTDPPYNVSLVTPANILETIAVGASTNDGKKAEDSNYGPEIDFIAPSSGWAKRIFTNDVPYKNRGFNIGRPGQGGPDGLYTKTFGGTSFATPLAAGIAALVLSVNPNPKGEQVRQILKRTCNKIDRSSNAHYDTNGFSISHGFGRLDAGRALEIAKEMRYR